MERKTKMKWPGTVAENCECKQFIHDSQEEIDYIRARVKDIRR